MDHNFWHDKWQKTDIGFHRSNAHALLEQHWHKLKLRKGSKVFVPLCGKSHDMVWLAEKGHQIVGSELSAIAIDAFFTEQGLQAKSQTHGSLVLKASGSFDLWQGDFFALSTEALLDVAAVYDRAAVVALPSDLQQAYSQKLLTIIPPSAPIFLISLHFDQSEIKGPPFSTPPATIQELFGNDFEIDERCHHDALATNKNLKDRGLTTLTESLFVLHRRQ